MNDKQLDIFLKLSECGSFSRAERDMYLSRQALMRQMDRLEAEVGAKLFVRTPAGLTLTKAGRLLKEGLAPLRRQMNELCAMCRGASQECPRLRIEIPRHPHSLLDRAITVFSERYPDVRLDIVRATSAGRAQRIVEGKIDIAEIPYREELSGANLRFIHLVNNRFFCLVAQGHPLCRLKSVGAGDLLTYPVYVNSFMGRRGLISRLEQEEPALSFKEIEGEEMDAILNVCYNSGVYLTPAYFAPRMEYLTAVPLRCPVTQEIGLICRVGEQPLVERFIEIGLETVSS